MNVKPFFTVNLGNHGFSPHLYVRVSVLSSYKKFQRELYLGLLQIYKVIWEQLTLNHPIQEHDSHPIYAIYYLCTLWEFKSFLHKTLMYSLLIPRYSILFY